ncbi:unnamed protein product [Urochloa humidicola]
MGDSDSPPAWSSREDLMQQHRKPHGLHSSFMLRAVELAQRHLPSSSPLQRPNGNHEAAALVSHPRHMICQRRDGAAAASGWVTGIAYLIIPLLIINTKSILVDGGHRWSGSNFSLSDMGAERHDA